MANYDYSNLTPEQWRDMAGFVFQNAANEDPNHESLTTPDLWNKLGQMMGLDPNYVKEQMYANMAKGFDDKGYYYADPNGDPATEVKKVIEAAKSANIDPVHGIMPLATKYGIGVSEVVDRYAPQYDLTQIRTQISNTQQTRNTETSQWMQDFSETLGVENPYRDYYEQSQGNTTSQGNTLSQLFSSGSTISPPVRSSANQLPQGTPSGTTSGTTSGQPTPPTPIPSTESRTEPAIRSSAQSGGGSMFENFFKTLFGDSTDAIDAAGDAQQARLVQAIDLFNENFNSAQNEMLAGKDEFVGKVKETLDKVKQEILAGNADVANKLRQGLDEQIGTLAQAYGVTRDALGEAFNLAEQKLMTGQTVAKQELQSAYNQARGDIGTGRTNALSALRTSLTNSLNSISQGRDQASQAIRQSLERTRQNYAPYITAGQSAITRAEQLTNDPNAQRDYVTNNPFFSAMQETARDQLFSNQAARGRLGTGETLDELDKRTLLLGEQLVGNAVERNLGISSQGLNAINNMGSMEMNGGNILAQIFQNAAAQEVGAQTNFGNNAATTEMNAGNVLANLANQFGINTADITTGTYNNLAEILSNYGSQAAGAATNLGGAAANAVGNYWSNLTNLVNNQTQQHSGLTQLQGMTDAQANYDYRNNYANMILGGTATTIPLLAALGESEANEAIGEQAAQRQSFNDLLSLASVVMTGINVFGGNKTAAPTATFTPYQGGGYSAPLPGTGFYGGSSVNMSYPGMGTFNNNVFQPYNPTNTSTSTINLGF